MGRIPALNQSEAPSEVLSEGESRVQSCGVQALGAADQLSHQQGTSVHVHGMIHEGLVIVPDSCKEVLSNGCAADMGVVDDMSS